MARKIEYLYKRAVECGWTPVAISGDMGDSNTETQKELGVKIDPDTGLVSSNSFLIRLDDGTEREVFIIADPPHLVKNFRNGLYSYDFILSDEVCAAHGLASDKVSFDHIRELANFSQGTKWKYGAHLNDDYFIKDSVHFNKMNVQIARKILSDKVRARHMFSRIHNFLVVIFFQ